MATMSKSRRERLKLKPKDVRLFWALVIATTIIVLLELYAGVTALTP